MNTNLVFGNYLGSNVFGKFLDDVIECFCIEKKQKLPSFGGEWGGLSVLFAEGLCADARVDTEIFAETACRGKIHTESNLFDALVGGEQTLFNLANGNLVDDVRGCLFCHLIADIGQVFGTNSHLVCIPRYGVAGGAFVVEYMLIL